MIKFKYIIFILLWLFSSHPIYAQETTLNWINKKLLKVESQSEAQIIENNSKVSSVVTSIKLDDLVEQNVKLPYYYWSWSDIEDISKKIDSISLSSNPLIRNLFTAVLISEMPVDLNSIKERDLYLIRLNKLIELGKFKEAQLFINVNDPTLKISSDPQFIINIIRGNDTLACAQYKKTESITPSLKKKLYCLTYENEMQQAKIIFETANILNFTNTYETEILKILLSNQQEIPFFIQKEGHILSALDYVILSKKEAISNDIIIPITFLSYDFNQSINSRKKLIAGERLAKIGTISAKQLFQLYKNGIIDKNYGVGLKERILVISSLEKSINSNDPVQIKKFLTKGFSDFEKIGLSNQFCEYYKDHILKQQDLGWKTPISIKMNLLTGDYSKITNKISINSNFISAQSIAKNDYSKLGNISAFEESIISAIRDPIYKEENIILIEQGRIGEVILSSISLLTIKTGNINTNIKNGLRGLMQTGLEKIAKLIAIQYILMD